MNKQVVLTRGLANYYEEDGTFHKCFAVSNGETFVYWFGGIRIQDPFTNVEFEKTNPEKLNEFKILYPESQKFYELMEEHFELCVILSNMECPSEFETIGFKDSHYMTDFPGFDMDEDYERMEIFHHQNNNKIHAVFGDSLDSGYGFVNLLIGLMDDIVKEKVEKEIAFSNEMQAYRGLHRVTGHLLDFIGFVKPADDKKESIIFFEIDGGISQLLEDRNGNLHVFHRHGNDVFSYYSTFYEWTVEHSKSLIELQRKYSEKANACQELLQEILLEQEQY